MKFITIFAETKARRGDGEYGVCAKERKGVAAEVLMATPAARGTVMGASTPMKMCIQADLETTGALRHELKQLGEICV